MILVKGGNPGVIKMKMKMEMKMKMGVDAFVMVSLILFCLVSGFLAFRIHSRIIRLEEGGKAW